MPIIFVDVSPEFNIDLKRDEGIYSKKLPPECDFFNFGYKCMCRFWFYAFLKYTNKYKYVIRIDEDCIVKEFSYTIFNKMMSENIYLSAPSIVNDFNDGIYADGMKECVNEFMIINSDIVSKQLNFGDSVPVSPYTNFVIIDVDYFMKSILFKRWYEFIENDGGIFVNRWGDMPLWGLFLSFSDVKYYEEKSILYYHKSHNLTINY